MDVNTAKRYLQALMNKRRAEAVPTLGAYLKDLSAYPLYLYGAGAFGRGLFQRLTANGINVQGFIDRSATRSAADKHEMLGVPVYNPHDIPADIKNKSLVIVSIVMTHEDREALWAHLLSLGFSNLADGQSIRALEIPFDEGHGDIDWTDGGVVADVLHAAELFSDDTSREVYAQNMRAHISRDYRDYAKSYRNPQYFPRDVLFSKGYSNFVDCGAYTGDTYTQLLRSNENMHTYVGFEPEAANFKKLVSAVSTQNCERRQTFLYPCAVGGHTHISLLSANEGSSAVTGAGRSPIGDSLPGHEDLPGREAPSGCLPVQVVSLDEALPSFIPTMIKMDIEGAETEALQGAERIIRAHRPDLAVCVYHQIKDYFAIPLLLRRFNPGYRFYLRAHSSCTMETVLYATEMRA